MTQHKSSRLLHFFLGLASFVLTALPGVALMAADEVWIVYESESGVFKVRMLDGYGTSTVPFPIEDERAVNTEETAILVDQRPYKDTMKSYIVKFDQTFGPALTEKEMPNLLDQEFGKYINYYKGLEGVVRSQTREFFKKSFGGEIQISYRDPAFGIQSIRVRILYNESTRLQQIIVGHDEIMNSFQTRDFYDSLDFKSGIAVTDKDFLEAWKIESSPSNMFTFVYPAKMAPPYYTQLPIIKFDKDNEVVNLWFNDPVRNEKLFYNIYGYKFNAEMSFDAQKEVLIKRNIMKYRSSVNGVKFAKGMDTETKTPFMETVFAIKPSPQTPYIRMVKLKSYFAGNYMIVQEMMTSGPLFNSTLAGNLMKYMKFTPDKVRDPVMPTLYSAPVALAPIKKMRKDAAVPTTATPSVPKMVEPENEFADPPPATGAPATQTPTTETPPTAAPSEAPATP